MDDKTTHTVTAFVPSLDALPLRLQFDLRTMPTESGWLRSRPVAVWVMDSSTVVRTRVSHAEFSMDQRTISVELQSEPRTHHILRRAIRRYGARLSNDREAEIDISLRLGRPDSGTDPVFELLATEDFATSLRRPPSTLSNTILDLVYGSSIRPWSVGPPTHHTAPPPISVRLRGTKLDLRADQARAVQMGTENRPLLAIQAAYGAGKTFVAAVIAARLATPGNLLVATATTNVAVAHITDTLLALNDHQDLKVLRFVADTSLKEGAPTTSVDMHRVLMDLVAKYSDSLSQREINRLRQYSQGRRLIERMIFTPETTVYLSDHERDKFRIAEYDSSEATEDVVAVMLKVRFPTILCITVSSLLRATMPGGLFHEVLSCCRVLIADEASQIPEPAFVAMTIRLPLARQIHVGDVNQLEPHIRCPRSTVAAQLGAKGLMELLLSKDIPLAPLVTTFRAHQALNELPNMLVYNGSLISGTQPHQRSLLTDKLQLPNPSIPFVFVDVEGTSRVSHAQSHSNQEKAACCVDVVRSLLRKDIPPASIGVITFYKHQLRLLRHDAARLGFQLHTVDSVQGREIDVTIVLTTRSNVDTPSGEFLDDPKRMNVAVTRCRHGQFVLGRVVALRRLHNWDRLLQWATARDVVVNRSDLPDIFE